MTVEGFSAGKIEFTAGYFPRLPAIIYIPAPKIQAGTIHFNTCIASYTDALWAHTIFLPRKFREVLMAACFNNALKVLVHFLVRGSVKHSHTTVM